MKVEKIAVAISGNGTCKQVVSLLRVSRTQSSRAEFSFRQFLRKLKVISDLCVLSSLIVSNMRKKGYLVKKNYI